MIDLANCSWCQVIKLTLGLEELYLCSIKWMSLTGGWELPLFQIRFNNPCCAPGSSEGSLLRLETLAVVLIPFEYFGVLFCSHDTVAAFERSIWTLSDPPFFQRSRNRQLSN